MEQEQESYWEKGILTGSLEQHDMGISRTLISDGIRDDIFYNTRV